MPGTNLRDVTPGTFVVTAERFWGSVRRHCPVRHTAPADTSPARRLLQQLGGVKVKVTLDQARKAQKWSRSIAVLFL